MKNSLITANELAVRLGIRGPTVYLWVRQKGIPFYRVGRLVKFDEEEPLRKTSLGPIATMSEKDMRHEIEPYILSWFTEG